MFLVERNYIIQEFSAAAPHPALRDAVLPRRPNAGSCGRQTCDFQEITDLGAEPAVAVQNHVTVRASLRKSFTQLLDHPLCRRVPGHIEVNNLPPAVFHDEE